MDHEAIPGKEKLLDIQEIADGGERVSHLDRDYVYYAHLSIYDFAVQFCHDALVLDAGSGAGYGPAYLSDAGARHVWGIDASKKAIGFSQHHFQRPNLTFQVMNLEQIEGFPAQHFDFIYSSNTLEHVPHVISFLRESWKLLKPTGILLLAVPPITDERLQYLNLINPHHVNIWSPRQWAYALGMYFKEIEYYLHGVETAGADFKPEHLTPASTLTEKSFVFEKGDITEMYEQFTLTAIIVARKPLLEAQVPAADAPLEFVDESFTRPQGYIAPDVSRRLKKYFDMPAPPFTVWAESSGEGFSARQKIRDARDFVWRKLHLS